jgi:CRISPR/Cas system CSM-associated protein Csm3 (group 7 of RAMP superfamily)
MTLGGQGSRGYGKIKFEGVSLSVKTITDYLGENTGKPLAGVTF